MLGKTLGGATVAVIQGLLVSVIAFVVGFRAANAWAIPLALVFMVLIAFLFAALGMAIGSAIENFQGFQLIMNFLVLPIFFLSGALYPLDNLPVFMSFVTHLDPLAYGVDGLRTTLIGRSHFSLSADALVLLAVGTVLLFVGSYLFSKIEV
jgi:ABC-2 type transport system permease protein